MPSMCPHVPPRSFHHPVATLSDVYIPKIWIVNTPQPPHLITRLPFPSSKFHLRKFQLKRRSTSPNFSQNNFTRNFSRDFHKKSFRHMRWTHGSQFSKMPHRTFREDSPASNPNLIQPTHKNRKLCPDSAKKKLCKICWKIFRKFLKFILATCSQWKIISWITRPLQNFSRTRPGNSKTPGRHYPPTIYVIAPSQNHPILQCRSGLPVEPVTGNYLSGSPYPSRVSDLSRVRYLSWESTRNREIHVGVRSEDTSVLTPKQPLLSFFTYFSPSGMWSPVQKRLLAHFSEPDSCQNQSNGRHIRDMIKQRTWFFVNKTWFGQPGPSPNQDSPTEKWVRQSVGHMRVQTGMALWHIVPVFREVLRKKCTRCDKKNCNSDC